MCALQRCGALAFAPASIDLQTEVRPARGALSRTIRDRRSPFEKGRCAGFVSKRRNPLGPESGTRHSARAQTLSRKNIVACSGFSFLIPSMGLPGHCAIQAPLVRKCKALPDSKRQASVSIPALMRFRDALSLTRGGSVG